MVKLIGILFCIGTIIISFTIFILFNGSIGWWLFAGALLIGAIVTWGMILDDK